RRERGHQTLIGEERRVDPAREVSEVVERVLCVALQLLEHWRELLGRLGCGRLREVQLHGEGYQLLLRAVVDVALEPSSCFVLRGDEPKPRRAEVLDQSD